MNLFRIKLLCFVFTVIVLPATGQLPASDIYLCNVKWNQKNILVENPVLLSSFNIDNYNNQPFFQDYHNIFITSGDTSDKTDIVKLNLNEKEYFYFTKTNGISEFSPQLTPDGLSISVVRIEKDGKTQTLWSYPTDRSHYGKNVVPNLINVGYHVWIDVKTVALFLVDSFPKLAIANIETGSVNIIQENIGRCLKYKNGNLFFTIKGADNKHAIKKYNISDVSIEEVALMPEKTEDFEVLTNGNIIFGEKSQIKMLNVSTSPPQVSVVCNFEEYGINNINRLVSERDRIVFVNLKTR
jgi:hypothetical protein